MVMYTRPETKERTEETKFTATLTDDNEKEFQVEISYDHHDYFPSWGPVETMVTGFDYKVEGSPAISKKELSQWVKDQIQDNEKRSTFFY
jgi:hypothetical protein